MQMIGYFLLGALIGVVGMIIVTVLVHDLSNKKAKEAREK